MLKGESKKSSTTKTKKGKELSEKTMGKVNGGGNPFGEITVQLLCKNCGTVLEEFRTAKEVERFYSKMFCEKCNWYGFPIPKEIEE